MRDPDPQLKAFLEDIRKVCEKHDCRIDFYTTECANLIIVRDHENGIGIVDAEFDETVKIDANVEYPS